jgi:hypothetical protein
MKSARPKIIEIHVSISENRKTPLSVSKNINVGKALKTQENFFYSRGVLSDTTCPCHQYQANLHPQDGGVTATHCLKVVLAI